METLFGVLVGMGLAASCGFRVFVPLLVMSIAVKAGQLELADGWSWIGSWPALVTFAAATLIEIGGFYIPWLDNLLDTISLPAAVIAGTITTAACVSNMSPLLQWSTALIAGGGIAGGIQGATALARGASTTTTGGAGNFIIATFELFASLCLSLLSIVVPVLAMLVLCLAGVWMIRILRRLRARRVIVVNS